MCVIIYSPDVLPTQDTLRDAEFANGDGGGLAWKSGGRIHWAKGLTAMEMYAMIEDKQIKPPLITHFRIATEGGVSEELCHPFPVVKKMNNDIEGVNNTVLFHNGIWRNWEETAMAIVTRHAEAFPLGPWSDSRAMAWISAYCGVGFPQLTEEKVAVMSRNHVHIFGTGWSKFSENEGVHHASNNFFLSSSTFYGGAHKGVAKKYLGTTSTNRVSSTPTRNGVPLTNTTPIATTGPSTAEKKEVVLSGRQNESTKDGGSTAETSTTKRATDTLKKPQPSSKTSTPTSEEQHEIIVTGDDNKVYRVPQWMIEVFQTPAWRNLTRDERVVLCKQVREGRFVTQEQVIDEMFEITCKAEPGENGEPMTAYESFINMYSTLSKEVKDTLWDEYDNLSDKEQDTMCEAVGISATSDLGLMIMQYASLTENSRSSLWMMWSHMTEREQELLIEQNRDEKWEREVEGTEIDFTPEDLSNEAEIAKLLAEQDDEAAVMAEITAEGERIDAEQARLAAQGYVNQ
jgi:hypothetical protein